ncbi:hypothetical protein Ait01nite_083890 [Actinoplanes italicus]|nr:hypothetical protein Ait01nite_083890 [Actinoplanes italicus]
MKLPDGTFLGSREPAIAARTVGKLPMGMTVEQIAVDPVSLEVSIALGVAAVRIVPSGYQPSGWRSEDGSEPLPYWKLRLPEGAALSVGPGLTSRWSTSRE